MARSLVLSGADSLRLVAAPASPVPTGTPAPAPEAPVTSDVFGAVLENVLTNLLTVIVLPLVVPLLCLIVGAAWHLIRGDLRPWWRSVRDFFRLAGSSATAGFGGTVRYWLALLMVLLRGKLSDPSVLDRPAEGRGT
jgi:hypothetical protein